MQSKMLRVYTLAASKQRFRLRKVYERNRTWWTCLSVDQLTSPPGVITFARVALSKRPFAYI